MNQASGKGTKRAFIRNSIVSDPLRRVKNGTIPPAVIHYEIKTKGYHRKNRCPQRFGSENMRAVKNAQTLQTPNRVLYEYVIET
jgi:tartrate dehydratase alpha subunit/fumarate hydratase class I-like protein